MSKDRVYVPPIKIQGIKTKTVPMIKENVMLQEDTIWVEPFMGSGIVGFNIGTKNAVFADTNPHIINFYNQIKDGIITQHTVREFLEHEGKKLEELDGEYYYTVRDRFNELHSPMDFLFLNRSCFNGMIRFNKNYRFNVPYGHKRQRFAKAYITKIVNQVAYIESMLKQNNWMFICQSFEKTIAETANNSFIYCDPPFIGRHVDYYDSWNEDLEINLRNALYNSGTNFMLSTWDYNEYRTNDYLKKVWGECNKITREHFYHVGAKERNRQPIVEALLVNYRLNPCSNLLLKENEQSTLEMIV